MIKCKPACAKKKNLLKSLLEDEPDAESSATEVYLYEAFGKKQLPIQAIYYIDPITGGKVTVNAEKDLDILKSCFREVPNNFDQIVIKGNWPIPVKE